MSTLADEQFYFDFWAELLGLSAPCGVELPVPKRRKPDLIFDSV